VKPYSLLDILDGSEYTARHLRAWPPKSALSPGNVEKTIIKTPTNVMKNIPQNKSAGSMRLQKYLSESGVCSRRKAEEYIAAGLVRVNGEIATIGQSVDPAVDTVTVDDKVVAERDELVYYKLNKPRGIVSTCSQP
jgi:ribosomal 50S subunit-recycling heat shock protein